MHVSECQLENALDCMDSNLFSCTFIALLPQRSFIANAASSADIEKGGFLPCAEAVKRRFADWLGTRALEVHRMSCVMVVLTSSRV